jgi:hypothetical protein
VDSLVLNNTIELMMNGAPSQDPRCFGATFWLLPAYSFGNPVPAVAGKASANRVHKIPVGISAPTREIVLAAREVLVALVDRPRWVMTWRKDGGPDTCFDCLRATSSVIEWDTKVEQQLHAKLTLTFDALPYARATAYELLAFPNSPTDALPNAPLPIMVDNYSSVSGTNWSQEAWS